MLREFSVERECDTENVAMIYLENKRISNIRIKPEVYLNLSYILP